MAAERQDAPPELPALDGGWELRVFDFPKGVSTGLWIPCEPEKLLDDVEVQERNAFNDSMPYWAWLWDSAPTMVTRLLEEGEPRGPRILELGAGLGLVGIALAQAAGPRASLELSDHDPVSQRVLGVNAAHNGLREVSVTGLDWLELEHETARPADVIVACDVLYEARLHDPLLDVLERFLAPGGCAYFADPGRTRLKGFLPRAAARGFRARLIDAQGREAEPEIGAFRIACVSRG